ncbi:hypothetical protein SAMN06298216_1014 [Spirosomataceae bacterium TFI 002]|nr:hypothetical protein SAMN06298216_1014 [Spirosomataceae bacterium TFI 002]
MNIQLLLTRKKPSIRNKMRGALYLFTLIFAVHYIGLAASSTIPKLSLALVDSDNDGVDDDIDLCPDTPANTIVNAYGCPITSACNLTNNSISFIAAPSNPSPSQVTQYIMADSLGIIVATSATPAFDNLSLNKSYMVVAVSYELNVDNLEVGNPISAIRGNCFDFSNALNIKACTPNLPPVIEEESFVLGNNVTSNSPIGTLTFRDPENLPANIAIISGNGSGIFAVDNLGVLTVTDHTKLTPSTTYTLIVEVTDNVGQKDQATITFTTNFAIPLVDGDNDGVPNEKDLCPNSPQNVAVSSFGCPQTIACNLLFDTVQVSSAPNSPTLDQVTKYLLLDSLGTIVQISDNSTFLNFGFQKTFSIVAVSYEGTIQSLNLGENVGSITSDCLDFSNVQQVKACEQNEPPIIDDLTVSIANNTPNNTVIGSLIFSDPENQPLTFNIVSGNTEGYFNLDSNGNIRLVNNSNLLPNTTFIFTVEVMDHKGLKDMGEVIINILPAMLCDYVGPEITFTTTFNIDTTSQNTNYLLTDTLGAILQITSSPTFTGLQDGGSFNIYAVSYPKGKTVTGLNVGSNLSALSADCFDISNKLSVKVCPCKGKIGDMVFFDYNVNGTLDNTEPGLAGLKIYLLENGNIIDSTITNSYGKYLFSDLAKGIYQVYVDSTDLPFAYRFSNKNQGVDVTKDSDFDQFGFSDFIPICQNANGSDSLNLTVDLGISIGNWKPYGYIYCEETGEILKGGKVTITGPSGAVINYLADGSNGFYRFEANVSGVYTLSYTHPDGHTLSDLNLPLTSTPGSSFELDGSAFDKDGIVNGIISLGSLANSDTTFLINPSVAYNKYFLESFVDIGIPWLGENNLPVNCHRGEISGVLWNDENDNGINDSGESVNPNVWVYLWETGIAGNLIEIKDSVQTTSIGTYVFDNLPYGNYVVAIKTQSVPTKTITTKKDIGDDSIDSDFNPFNGLHVVLTISPSSLIYPNVSAGFVDACVLHCIPFLITKNKR